MVDLVVLVGNNGTVFMIWAPRTKKVDLGLVIIIIFFEAL